MAQSRQEKLAVYAARGGTENERAVAREKMGSLPAIRKEEADDTWTPRGEIVRDRRGAKAYLRGAALAYMLESVVEGNFFSEREMVRNENFGSGDFYVIISWMLKFDLCVKSGSRYSVPSKQNVKDKWNKSIKLAMM